MIIEKVLTIRQYYGKVRKNKGGMMETYYIVKLSSGRTIELFVNDESEAIKFVESNMDTDEEIVSIHERWA